MEISLIIREIQVFAPLPALLLLAIFWKSRNKDTIYLGLYLIASIIVNVLASKFQVQYVFGYFIQSYFGLFTILLFARMFSDFTDSKQPYIIGIIGTIIYLYCLIFVDKQALPTTSATVSFAFTMIYCFYYFYQLYKNEEDVFSNENLRFIAIAALFIYSSGATFTFLMLVKIANTTRAHLYSMHNVLSILSMFTFAYVIWKSHIKRQKPVSLG